HRPARDRRPARRDELVLPQGLLDRLDLDAQPAQAGTDEGELAVQAVARPGAAGIYLGLPRGLRRRAVPAKLSAEARHRSGDVGRGNRIRPDADRRPAALRLDASAVITR